MTLPDTLNEIAGAVTSRSLDVGEIVETVQRQMKCGRDLNAFITEVNGQAGSGWHDQASAIQRRLDSSDASSLPLAGVPIAVKDNIVTEGLQTTCASRILEGWIPPYDATAISRLKQAGALLAGKTNMDEFGMGSSTEFSTIGPTRNPYDLDRVPGGSSGGSAAAVAAGIVPAALGSDTGGSIRQPASYCGLVGVKPTYGRVSRYGLVAYASSLDQIGTLTRTVKDAAQLLQVIAGHDPSDSTSIDVTTPDLIGAIDRPAAGLRVGIVKEMLAEGTQPEVADAVQAAAAGLLSQGATVETVTIPSTDHALAAYYIIAPAEASSNLSRYDGVRFGQRVDGRNANEMIARSRTAGFGAEVKRRIVLGTFALSAGYSDEYYGKAQRVRALITDQFKQALQKFDVLIGPTAPTTAFRIGELIDDPAELYQMDVCTIMANLVGLPAASIPWGVDHGGLPIGIQLMTSHFQEETLFTVAGLLEREAPVLPAPAAYVRPE